MDGTLLTAALEHAARNWPVFPVAPRQKVPLIKGWPERATTDAGQIREWWEKWPDANLGVPTGRVFCAIDLDAPAALDWWEGCCERHDWRGGIVQRTGRGQQILLAPCAQIRTRKVSSILGVDTRGEGGFVVVAPSIHPNGREYVLEDYDGQPFDPVPDWLPEELEKILESRAPGEAGSYEPKDVPTGLERTMLEMMGFPLVRVPENGRNDWLMRQGCSLRARGQEHGHIAEALALANRVLCDPPLPEPEIAKIAASCATYAVSALYQRGVEAASGVAEKAHHAAQEAHQEEKTAEVLSGENQEDALALAGQLMGLSDLRIRQVGSDPAVYYLDALDREGCPATSCVANLLSHADVQRACFDVFGVVIRVSPKRWKKTAAVLRAAAVQEDPGLMDQKAEAGDWLERFLETHQAEAAETEEDWKRLRAQGEPVIAWKGEVYFRFHAFLEWAERAASVKGAAMLWRRLRSSGRAEDATRSFRWEGNVQTPRYWRKA